MKDYLVETAILAPAAVVNKAKELASIGCYDAALKILNNNKVEFDIYTDHMEIRAGRRYDQMPKRPKKKSAGNHFKKSRSAPDIDRTKGRFTAKAGDKNSYF
jgi:hypothetical protein